MLLCVVGLRCKDQLVEKEELCLAVDDFRVPCSAETRAVKKIHSTAAAEFRAWYL